MVFEDGVHRCSACRCFASTKMPPGKLLQRPCAGPPKDALERWRLLAAKWLERRMESPGLVHQLVAVSAG
eukprot:11659568-Alexandrium_andersonii.AAC.1